MTQESLTFEVARGGVSKTSFCTAVSVPSVSKASFRTTATSKPTNLPDPHSRNHLMYMLEPDGAMDDQTVDIPYDDKLSLALPNLQEIPVVFQTILSTSANI